MFDLVGQRWKDGGWVWVVMVIPPVLCVGLVLFGAFSIGYHLGAASERPRADDAGIGCTCGYDCGSWVECPPREPKWPEERCADGVNGPQCCTEPDIGRLLENDGQAVAVCVHDASERRYRWEELR